MPEEKFTLWEQVAKYAAPDKLLIAGTGVESVRETVLPHQSRRRNGLQSGHGPHAALLQEPDQPHRRADALLPRRGRPVQDPADHLQLAADHRRRYFGGGGGRPERASQHHRHQGKLGQPGKGDADDPRGEARLPGAGGLRAHAVAVAADGRLRGHPGLRQRRAVFGDRHLGSLPHPRRSGRPRLAEPHRPRRPRW